MILRFMDKFPDGSGTYFEEKLNHIKSPHRNMFVGPSGEIEVFPKIHTIRKDEFNRWIPGRSIQGYYHARTKRSRKIFDSECVSTQIISIIHYDNEKCLITVYDHEADGNYLGEKAILYNKKTGESIKFGEYEILDIQTLIKNDGLTVNQFFSWFKEDFMGKIIHWTDLRY